LFAQDSLGIQTFQNISTGSNNNKRDREQAVADLERSKIQIF
jgi:hypothetical protein